MASTYLRLKTLPQAVDLVNSPESFQPITVDAKQMLSEAAQYSVDLRDVHGQQAAKRALEVACAGGHNILFIGPPGAGKTMLAKRIPTILPPMSLEEAIETTRIHSVAGVLEDSRGLVGTRPLPLAAPHHQRRRFDRWRRRPAPRRSFSRPQWRSLPRRTPGIPAQRVGSHATAARRWRGDHFARRRIRHFSFALHAGRRHEPVPLRLFRRSRRANATAPRR